MPSSVQAAIAFRLALLGAPAVAARQLPAQFYTSVHGMPRNTARCLTPGSNGVLWICTSEGLVRFDGREFRVFGPEQGLPSRHVVAGLVSVPRFSALTRIVVCPIIDEIMGAKS